MKVLVRGEWTNGFVDYYRNSNEYRIQVLAWINIEKLERIYFTRPKSLRLVWNYIREVGLKVVLRKVLSRGQEQSRNEKYISFGVGRIIETADESQFCLDQIVAFLAPCHPACIERIVLPQDLIIKAERGVIPTLFDSKIQYKQGFANVNQNDCFWQDLRGWSSYSGVVLPINKEAELMKKVVEHICSANWDNAIQLPIDTNSIVNEVKGFSLKHRSKLQKNAVLFGYGHYAKTNVLPNIGHYLSIECIHEIDTTQIPLDKKLAMRWDTSPSPRDEEHYDVFLITGFHHTHAPLAIYALQHNSHAVVEKPIVVSGEQLRELITVMENSTGELFSCFHKRYLPFNEFVTQDLGLNTGDPVSYHCIIYEVPLPELHWYLWPNSKSRLVSNGCHWIDHFLYLNNFCDVSSFDLVAACDGTINCSVSLENDAFFTMVLTDRGSERIGVQDYIELRANEVSVKMINGSIYVAEDKNKILRRKKINKMKSYELMYQQIGEKILSGSDGDTAQSVKVSAGLIIALENKLKGLSDKN